MPIRLKELRKQEERINKVKELMDMYNVNPSYSNQYQQYQPIGASSLASNLPIDPKIQAQKNLFEMFHLAH